MYAQAQPVYNLLPLPVRPGFKYCQKAAVVTHRCTPFFILVQQSLLASYLPLVIPALGWLLFVEPGEGINRINFTNNTYSVLWPEPAVRSILTYMRLSP